MKKLFLSFVLIVFPFFLGALTLYEYFSGKLPTIAERTPVFNAYFPNESYRGTAEQNTKFVGKLVDSPLLGAAFSTISSTDQLSTFPATYNLNLGNSANTTTPNSWSGLQQFDGHASSSRFSCYGPCYFGATATSSFSTAGALTLITSLTVANGGTGSTTLSSNQVLLGNGTGNVGTVSGWGTDNYVLTSTGGTGAPAWELAQSDQTLNYAWTGNQRFGIGATTTRLVASSTSANPLILNTLSYNTKSVRAASSTALQEDGSGNLLFDKLDWQQLCEEILASANATSTCSWTGSSTDLLIVHEIAGASGNAYGRLTFNTDYGGAGTNYGYRVFQNYVSLGNISSGAAFIRTIEAATTTAQYFLFEASNVAGRNKRVMSRGTTNTTAPAIYTGTGVWANTSAQITQVNIRTDDLANTWSSGTRLTVYGKRN